MNSYRYAYKKITDNLAPWRWSRWEWEYFEKKKKNIWKEFLVSFFFVNPFSTATKNLIREPQKIKTKINPYDISKLFKQTRLNENMLPT